MSRYFSNISLFSWYNNNLLAVNESKEEIRVTDIANSLGVSKASVNKAIKQLDKKIKE
mgnify:CR=1 FL=1